MSFGIKRVESLLLTRRSARSSAQKSCSTDSACWACGAGSGLGRRGRKAIHHADDNVRSPRSRSVSTEVCSRSRCRLIAVFVIGLYTY